jgi:hypothetical protein
MQDAWEMVVLCYRGKVGRVSYRTLVRDQTFRCNRGVATTVNRK